jgi:hypothetical protein
MISGLVRSCVKNYLDGRQEIYDELHIDFTAPTIPLFSGNEKFPGISAYSAKEMFRLYWIDEVAALRASRTCVEAILSSRKFLEMKQRGGDGPALAEDFSKWRTESFSDRVRKEFSSIAIRRAFISLYDTGSFFSHFTPDTPPNHRISEHLDQVILILYQIFLSTSENSSEKIDLGVVSSLEKNFSRRAQKARLLSIFEGRSFGRV